MGGGGRMPCCKYIWTSGWLAGVVFVYESVLVVGGELKISETDAGCGWGRCGGGGY